MYVYHNDFLVLLFVKQVGVTFCFHRQLVAYVWPQGCSEYLEIFHIVLGRCSIHRGFGLALGASLLAYGSDLGRRPSPLVLGLVVLGLQFAIRQGFD